MPELTITNIEAVSQATLARLEALAQSLNRCFDTDFRLSAGERLPHASLGEIPQLGGPGVVVAFSVGASAMLCAISAELPLPSWYTDPSPEQISKLETLALEWSRDCLPDDLPGENFVSLTVPALGECIAGAAPVENAVCLPILASPDGSTPAANIWLIWPVSHIPTPNGPGGPSASDQDETADPAAIERGPAVPPPAQPTAIERLNRIRNLPVPIIVKLAEKRIEMGQLLAIGPGAIITFEKSCEDLLDLHVNNQLYCRGEAVKIGEKFGIKICEVGSTEERISAVLAIN